MTEDRKMSAQVARIRATWSGRERDILSDPSAERTQSNPNLKTIVSVRFTPNDVAIVAAAAERAGQPLSSFVRSCALTVAHDQDRYQQHELVEAELREQLATTKAELERTGDALRALTKPPVAGPRTRYRPYALADPR